MPITSQQKAMAQAVQHAAAHDESGQIRLLAGPGTGKSASIEERVRWLIVNGTDPSRIAAVSFTRASAADLQHRIHEYGSNNGVPEAAKVRVSTLHSLALRTLKAAGLLANFPVDPLVLDDWELESILDSEFGVVAAIPQKERREAIRRLYEAFWSTGAWDPPNYTPPNPPISAQETKEFAGYLGTRAQLYSCVLPGELVKQCVDGAKAGVLSLVALLDIAHLIVDEYQDLNPVDLEFIDILIAEGVTVFVAGDDDQSIYSFRHAAPNGIQDFAVNNPHASSHSLDHCFRCTPSVLQAAYSVIEAFPDPKRLSKTVTSLYGSADPSVAGVVHRWRFNTGLQEAAAISSSCKTVIASGVAPEQIMILLSNVLGLSKTIAEQLQLQGVPHSEPRSEPFSDSNAGRTLLALLRIVVSDDDYVAMRTLLGLRTGVGTKTCNEIAEAAITNNLNWKACFTEPLPTGVFKGRALSALEKARSVMSKLASWTTQETLGHRRHDFYSLVEEVCGLEARAAAETELGSLPDETLLSELRLFVGAPNDDRREAALTAIYARLGVAAPPAAVGVGRVRIMTMHGSKGLSAQVVFIPGLEQDLLPGAKRLPYPGKVAEAARLLFVSITRARAACILSFALGRMSRGTWQTRKPSLFATNLGGTFVARSAGLSPSESAAIKVANDNL